MRHACIWKVQNIQAHQLLCYQRKVRQWDSSLPGDLNASSNGSYGLLLSIMSSLNTVETFIMTWRGLAMQMRVRCFLRSAVRVVIFVMRLLRAHASAGISQQGSWCLHASRTSLRPSPGICNWLTDFQNIHRGYIFSSGLWTHAPDCHYNTNCKLL